MAALTLVRFRIGSAGTGHPRTAALSVRRLDTGKAGTQGRDESQPKPEPDVRQDLPAVTSSRDYLAGNRHSPRYEPGSR